MYSILVAGKGLALIHLAEKYPASSFTGFDLSSSALQQAREMATAKQLNNIQFKEKDLTPFQYRGRK